jgi:hypothetical protein
MACGSRLWWWELGVVVHACNPSTLEAEAGGLLVGSQPGRCEILPQKKKWRLHWTYAGFFLIILLKQYSITNNYFHRPCIVLNIVSNLEMIQMYEVELGVQLSGRVIA